MSKRPTKTTESRTDWARVMADERAGRPPTFNDDDTELTAEEVAGMVVRRRGERGRQKAPTKKPVNLRLDERALSFYKAIGRGWQTTVNDVLLAVAEGKPVKQLRAAIMKKMTDANDVVTESVAKVATKAGSGGKGPGSGTRSSSASGRSRAAAKR